MNDLRKHNRGYHRSPESLREELATGWGFIDGLTIGLIIGFVVAAIIVSHYGI